MNFSCFFGLQNTLEKEKEKEKEKQCEVLKSNLDDKPLRNQIEASSLAAVTESIEIL